MEVDSVPHAEVSRRLLGMDAGLHFLPRGRAEHAGSPTKIGEYWASGLPVVVSPNIGDSDRVIASRRVGVVVDAHSDEDYARSALALRALLREPDLRRRCRAAAEAHYALEPAIDRQIGLYAEVLRRARR
jgi:glycosyltransferase involved in cell wall biosynthesis